MKKETKIYKIENFLLRIIPSVYSNFGVLYSKKIFVTSSEFQKKKITINTRSDFFLNACFRTTDQQILATTRQSKKIQIFDLKKGLILRNLHNHSSMCRLLSFSPNGTNLISGDDSGMIIIWEISLEKLLYSRKIGESPLTCVSYWPNNNQVFASSSYDGFIKFFDIRSNNLAIASFNHGCGVESFNFSNKGKNLITIGGNKLKIWNLCERKLEFLIQEEKAITGLSIDQTENILYSCLNRNIKSLKFNVNKINHRLSFKKNIISFGCLSKNIIIGFSDKILLVKNPSFKKKIFETAGSKKIYPLKIKKEIYSNIFFLPKQKSLVIKNYQKYLSGNNNNKKKKNPFSSFIKKSIDNLVRNNKIKKILNILYESKKISVISLIIVELINQYKLKKILNQFPVKYLLFLMNFVSKNLNILFPSELFDILLRISEKFFPMIYIFYSNYKIEACIKILRNLIKKSVNFYILRYCIELKNFYL
nr:U3 small nucleolar ribonucleoprotein [Cryptomonas curvata]